ncbi:uncharacterized protein EI97DRAFT_58592 [Westerdykella ornata]|uniref:Uncharacterized protein n=1 Tax=Westerdykella ornata TaxID=318751 RepID=A0A6A6JLR7_WESOR|nr:uncharacterized protein EI97DRAFT_58592 [Westerdykella ornata]KAF2275859.1 hypothetical protein EI97DRAFT_58592 [Westerdykella ornata]
MHGLDPASAGIVISISCNGSGQLGEARRGRAAAPPAPPQQFPSPLTRSCARLLQLCGGRRKDKTTVQNPVQGDWAAKSVCPHRFPRFHFIHTSDTSDTVHRVRFMVTQVPLVHNRPASPDIACHLTAGRPMRLSASSSTTTDSFGKTCHARHHRNPPSPSVCPENCAAELKPRGCAC